jgi:hypothetical protein
VVTIASRNFEAYDVGLRKVKHIVSEGNLTVTNAR